MQHIEEILATLRMVKQEKLDVRTITMGINLGGCSDPDIEQLCRKVHDRIVSAAAGLSETCAIVSGRYGIPIVHRRLAVTPVARFADGHNAADMLAVAHAMDKAAAAVGVDLIGGYSAMVHGGMTTAAANLIESLPLALSQTQRVCASLSVATSRAGINIDAVARLGQSIRDIADATADRNGFGAAKLVLFANAPEDNPFMAGAFLGEGSPDVVIHIGVSGPGVVKSAVERLCNQTPGCRLQDIANEIKSAAFRITRVGELIGREVASMLGATFGIVDLSLAPSPTPGNSVGEILSHMGIAHIGQPGSTAALGMLNDAVKKGGLFASSSVGGLSGAFLPVMEDTGLSASVEEGHLSLEKLEAMTAVCSVGLDMILIPGDTSAGTIAGIIADEMAIGVYNNKTTATRLIPAPGKKPGERVSFGGLFGESVVMRVADVGQRHDFIRHGGRIPAPLQSLRN